MNPISIEELSERGMDDRLTEVVQGIIGERLQPKSPDLKLSRQEMTALGYGPVCPCGEKGMSPGEGKCNCGEACNDCGCECSK